MISTYTMVHWIFFFLLYSFVGWCYESTYISITEKHLVNRGFMLGPFLPIYGSGAIVMLVVSTPFRDNILLTFIAGCIGATALEYVTGVVMESLFKVRYWDYSNMKFNFQGHICLLATLAWGSFTVIMTRIIHTPIESLVMQIPYTVLRVITTVISVYVIVDFTLSFKTALDLRDVLVKMDKIKDEFVKLQKRADVFIAFATDNKEKEASNYTERVDIIISNLEVKMKQIKEMLPKLELSDERREEIADMIVKFRLHQENRFQMSHIKDFYQKAILKGNPNMVSVKFKEALEELKNAAKESRKKK